MDSNGRQDAIRRQETLFNRDWTLPAVQLLISTLHTLNAVRDLTEEELRLKAAAERSVAQRMSYNAQQRQREVR